MQVFPKIAAVSMGLGGRANLRRMLRKTRHLDAVGTAVDAPEIILHLQAQSGLRPPPELLGKAV